MKRILSSDAIQGSKLRDMIDRRGYGLYCIGLSNGNKFLADIQDYHVIGMDYLGEKLIGCFTWDGDITADEMFFESSHIQSWLKDISYVYKYAEELQALEGETGVPYEDIKLDVPANRGYTRRDNILTPGRTYNLFKDYNFGEIVSLVNKAVDSPDHTAEGINHGVGHEKMICTILE